MIEFFIFEIGSNVFGTLNFVCRKKLKCIFANVCMISTPPSHTALSISTSTQKFNLTSPINLRIIQKIETKKQLNLINTTLKMSLSAKAQQFCLPSQTYLNFGIYELGDVCPTTGTIFVKPVPKLVHSKGLVLFKGTKKHIAGVKGKDHADCVPYADYSFDFAKTAHVGESKWWDKPLVFGKIARASRAEFCFLPTGELVGSVDKRLARGGRNPKDQVKYAKLSTMTKEQRIEVIKSGTLDSLGKSQGKKTATSKKIKSVYSDADTRLMGKFIKRANAVEYLKSGETDDINVSYEEDSKNGFPFQRADYRKELERMMRIPAIAGRRFQITRPQQVELGEVRDPFGNDLWREMSVPVLETEYLSLTEFWTALNEEFMETGEFGEECRLNFGAEEESVFVMSDDEDAEEEEEIKVEAKQKRKTEVIALAEGGDLISQLVLEAQKKDEPVVEAEEVVVEEEEEVKAKAVEEVIKPKKKGRGKGKKNKKTIAPLPKANFDDGNLSDEVVDAMVAGMSDEEVAKMADM